jgi:hypothetical protein
MPIFTCMVFMWFLSFFILSYLTLDPESWKSYRLRPVEEYSSTFSPIFEGAKKYRYQAPFIYILCSNISINLIEPPFRCLVGLQQRVDYSFYEFPIWIDVVGYMT